jgi:hypothetical protein
VGDGNRAYTLYNIDKIITTLGPRAYEIKMRKHRCERTRTEPARLPLTCLLADGGQRQRWEAAAVGSGAAAVGGGPAAGGGRVGCGAVAFGAACSGGSAAAPQSRSLRRQIGTVAIRWSHKTQECTRCRRQARLVGLGQCGGGGGGGGGARPDLPLFTTKSPSSFLSRVIKSRVSGTGARVGRGERRGESQW